MQLLDYTVKLIKNIKSNFEEAKVSCSVASIHDLRVAIKRLRSVFQILSDIDESLKKRRFNQDVRKLFKAAGRVRDLQVAEELIWNWSQKSLHQVSEYFNYLKENEFNARNEFISACKEFRMKSLDNLSSTILKHFRAFEKNELQTLVRQNTLEALEKLVAHKNGRPVSFETLHNLRIEAKDARYRLQVLMLINENSDELKELDSWLRDLHRSIGLWHDYVVAAEKLHSFLTHDIVKSINSAESYEVFATELQERADESYAVFNDVWRDDNNIIYKFLKVLQVSDS